MGSDIQADVERAVGRIDERHLRGGCVGACAGGEREAPGVGQRIASRVRNLCRVADRVGGAGGQRVDGYEGDRLVIGGVAEVAVHRIAAGGHGEAGLRGDGIELFVELEDNRRAAAVLVRKRDVGVAVDGAGAGQSRAGLAYAESGVEVVFDAGEVIAAGILNVIGVAQVDVVSPAGCECDAGNDRRDGTRRVD